MWEEDVLKGEKMHDQRTTVLKAQKKLFQFVRAPGTYHTG